MSEAPRRLPILQTRPAPEPQGDDERPPWHWAGIGAVLIFAIWAPLAMLAQVVERRLLAGLVAAQTTDELGASMANLSGAARAEVYAVAVGIPAIAFVLAAASGGALVGKFGGKAGPKEATVAGFVAAATAWALAAVRVGLFASLSTLVVAGAIGTLAAWAGGRIGYRSRSAIERQLSS